METALEAGAEDIKDDENTLTVISPSARGESKRPAPLKTSHL